ncbi:uncharacterized protein N7483_006016 [Penicillium malachiteum]|uniref:uncharacterized protein n=1 Tax=Penicillium malachiteum TaxID=1324776 RepID=UPI002547C447|nr:uncharacterized protein N7483_006016 [Penicillium malachiteum]KAJ5731508.1 hypothetical protein N7483_006016 [Penicillium malachiteum]
MKVSCFGEYDYEKSVHLRKAHHINYGFDEIDVEQSTFLRMADYAREFEDKHARLSMPLLDACALWWKIKFGCHDAEGSISWEVIQFGDLFVTILTDICHSTPDSFVPAGQQRLGDGQLPSLGPEHVTLENAYQFVLSLLPSQMTDDSPFFGTTDPDQVRSSNYRLIENASIFIKKLAFLAPLFGEIQAMKAKGEQDVYHKTPTI